jgi:hypothetical protein
MPTSRSHGSRDASSSGRYITRGCAPAVTIHRYPELLQLATVGLVTLMLAACGRTDEPPPTAIKDASRSVQSASAAVESLAHSPAPTGEVQAQSPHNPPTAPTARATKD